jgi:ABC-2 type transport system ATP-binding protein
VIAEGTSDDLKMRIGGEVLSVRVADRSKVGAAAGAVLGLAAGAGNVDNNTGELTLPVGSNGPGILTEAVRRLDEEKIELADIGLRRPSLDDVFMSLTGHTAEQSSAAADETQERGRRKRER